MRRAHALIVIAVLSTALIAACGDDETADQPPASAQAQAQTTTEEQTGSDAPAKQDQPAKEKEQQPAAGDGHSPLGGSPTCAEAEQAVDEAGGCRGRHEAPPRQPSEAPSSTKEDKPPPPVDPNTGHVGKEPGKPTLGAEQERGSTKDKPPPLVDPNAGHVGEEPGKPTLGAEQERYSNAETRCDLAAETPEEKEACYQ